MAAKAAGPGGAPKMEFVRRLAELDRVSAEQHGERQAGGIENPCEQLGTSDTESLADRRKGGA